MISRLSGNNYGMRKFEARYGKSLACLIDPQHPLSIGLEPFAYATACGLDVCVNDVWATPYSEGNLYSKVLCLNGKFVQIKLVRSNSDEDEDEFIGPYEDE